MRKAEGKEKAPTRCPIPISTCFHLICDKPFFLLHVPSPSSPHLVILCCLCLSKWATVSFSKSRVPNFIWKKIFTVRHLSWLLDRVPTGAWVTIPSLCLQWWTRGIWPQGTSWVKGQAKPAGLDGDKQGPAALIRDNSWGCFQLEIPQFKNLSVYFINP